MTTDIEQSPDYHTDLWIFGAPTASVNDIANEWRTVIICNHCEFYTIPGERFRHAAACVIASDSNPRPRPAKNHYRKVTVAYYPDIDGLGY